MFYKFLLANVVINPGINVKPKSCLKKTGLLFDWKIDENRKLNNIVEEPLDN
jgi:hypothetical protein